MALLWNAGSRAAGGPAGAQTALRTAGSAGFARGGPGTPVMGCAGPALITSAAPRLSPRPSPPHPMSETERHLTATTRVRRAAAAQEYPLGEHDLMLYVEGRDVLHALNLPAWAVWELCDGVRPLGEVAALLAAEAGVPAEQVLPDVLAVADQLAGLGLLESV